MRFRPLRALASGARRHRKRRDLRDRQYRNPVIQRVGFVSRVYYPEMRQIKIVECCAHGTRGAGSVAEPAFEAVAAAAAHQQHVKFGAAMRRPEVECASPEPGCELFDHEPLERRTKFRMAGDIFARFQREQRVQKARVAQVYLGRPDLAFPGVCKPWRERPPSVSRSRNVAKSSRPWSRCYRERGAAHAEPPPCHQHGNDQPRSAPIGQSVPASPSARQSDTPPIIREGSGADSSVLAAKHSQWSFMAIDGRFRCRKRQAIMSLNVISNFPLCLGGA